MLTGINQSNFEAALNLTKLKLISGYPEQRQEEGRVASPLHPSVTDSVQFGCTGK